MTTSDTNHNSLSLDDAYREIRKQSITSMKQGEEVFVPTKSFQKAQDLLARLQILVVRGLPCSGKTTLGQALLRHFAALGFSPLILQSCQEWRKHVRRDKKQIVLLDCVFGEVRVEQSRYIEWSPIIQSLDTFVQDYPDCMVVIVLPTHIMTELDRMTKPDDFLFQHFPLVDLDDQPFTFEEKKEMLTRHLSLHNLTLHPEAVHEIIHHDTSGSAFPWCCRNFVKDFSKTKYTNLRYDHEVFSFPGLARVRFFCDLLVEPENWKDLVPVLILALSKHSFVLSQDEQMEMKLRMLGMVTIDVDIDTLLPLANLLKGSILNDQLAFRTKALSSGFSYALFKTGHVALFLNACTAEFLVKHVNVEPTSNRTDIIIDDSSVYYRALLKRICQEILKCNVVQLCQHPAFQNEKFLVDFEAYVLEKRCLKAVISAKDYRQSMPMLYWSAWNRAGMLTCWCLRLILPTTDGSVVRQAFLACCLFGEKVTSPRVVRMFHWLVEDRNIINDSVSSVFLPIPDVDDRLTRDVKMKCHKVLNEQICLPCGLFETVSEQSEENNPAIERFLPVKMIHTNSSKAFQEADNVFDIRMPLESPNTIQARQMDTVSTQIPDIALKKPRLPSISNNPLNAAEMSLGSNASVSSSGTYISLLGLHNPDKQSSVDDDTLSVVMEDGSEGTDLFSIATVPIPMSEDEASTASTESRSSSLFSGITPGSCTSTRVGDSHFKSRQLLPPTIVKIHVDNTKVMILPICSRWYTFLRLVSMCDTDEVNSEGYTLLHTASYNGELNVVQFLLEGGADLAALTKQGNTPLTKAVDRNQVPVAAYLLEQGSKQMSMQSPTTTTSLSTRTAGQHLAWMFGTRKLYDLLHKIVQKKRAKMLHLLLSYGILLTDEIEMNNLLKEARSVNDNEAIIRILTDMNRLMVWTDTDDNHVYSVPFPL